MNPKGIVIDASALNLIFGEIRNNHSDDAGPLECLLNEIVDLYGVAYNKVVHREWEDVCGYEYLGIWLAELSKGEKATEVSTEGDNQIAKKLRTKFGLPQNSKDYSYVACATKVSPHYVLAQDIDFYDPKKKSSHPKDKARARRDRQGTLCKYAKKQLCVNIGCFCHPAVDLCLPSTSPISAFPECHLK